MAKVLVKFGKRVKEAERCEAKAVATYRATEPLGAL